MAETGRGCESKVRTRVQEGRPPPPSLRACVAAAVVSPPVLPPPVLSLHGRCGGSPSVEGLPFLSEDVTLGSCCCCWWGSLSSAASSLASPLESPAERGPEAPPALGLFLPVGRSSAGGALGLEPSVPAREPSLPPASHLSRLPLRQTPTPSWPSSTRARRRWWPRTR